MKQWGARLHPLGEMNIFDFLMEASGDIDKQRIRLSGLQIQILAFFISSAIFGRKNTGSAHRPKTDHILKLSQLLPQSP
ncbi:hypothetical protein BDF19DRAFT_419607 [Syncephalis fuscata]|nr:hypothetical protein BDF19DRAFT_419607 [Syncephalis fuscata]